MSIPSGRSYFSPNIVVRHRWDEGCFRKLWAAFLVCPLLVVFAVLIVVGAWTMLGVGLGCVAELVVCREEKRRNGTNGTVFS